MTAGNEFIRQTSYHKNPESAQKQGLPQPPLELPYSPSARLIDLPAPEDLEVAAIDLRQAVEQRVSVRKYGNTPLSMVELSYLLWMTQGVKQVTNRPATLRTVPSAGARHPFETYLLINRVDGLQPGLYRYAALEHALLELDLTAGVNENLTTACLEQKQIFNSAVTFFWVAVVDRMMWRYPERGYRYLFLDAGHICQNLYLAAEAVDCGVCAIAAFDDDLLNPALGLDGETLFVAYAGSLGKKECPDETFDIQKSKGVYR